MVLLKRFQDGIGILLSLNSISSVNLVVDSALIFLKLKTLLERK
jgi:hypothetical protein